MTRSLGRLAEESLARLGDHRSLVHEGRWHTASALHDRAARLSRGLGVPPGARVVVCTTNSPDVLVAYGALWRAGAVPVPVLPALTVTELRHVLVDSGAVVALASPPSLALVVQAAQALPVRVVVTGDVRLPGADASLAELEAAPEGPVVDRDGDDLAALLYTGGTTGRAKGVMLTHAGLSEISRARAQVFAQSGAVDLLLPLPLSHVYGLLNSVTRMHLPE
ncbi:MAG TPA: AMP-binding protein, partial [Mycobacteriales bacterium]|nr:AMP-binding protein [Mycobacteriales bacterium]